MRVLRKWKVACEVLMATERYSAVTAGGGRSGKREEMVRKNENHQRNKATDAPASLQPLQTKRRGFNATWLLHRESCPPTTSSIDCSANSALSSGEESAAARKMSRRMEEGQLEMVLAEGGRGGEEENKGGGGGSTEGSWGDCRSIVLALLLR